MGLLIDLVNDTQSANGLFVTAQGVTTQGASNDFNDGEIATNMVVNVSLPTIANVTSLVVQAEEWSGVTNGTGNGGTTWAAIPNMVVTVTATTTTANLRQIVRGLRTQQFARVNAITLAATTTTGAYSLCADLFSQKKIMAAAGAQPGYDRYPSS